MVNAKRTNEKQEKAMNPEQPTPTQRVDIFARELGVELASNRRNATIQCERIHDLIESKLKPLATEMERVQKQLNEFKATYSNELVKTADLRRQVDALNAKLADASLKGIDAIATISRLKPIAERSGCLLSDVDKLRAENAELQTVLEAWHSEFKTTQLTHASALLSELRKDKEKLVELLKRAVHHINSDYEWELCKSIRQAIDAAKGKE
jgi:predicted  nucleic acid-binding Zn-ribbon protein